LAADVAFEGGLRLGGLTAPATAARGETMRLSLYWHASGPLPADLTRFVHVGRGAASDPLVAHHDGPLCPGYGPQRWEPGYAYIETLAITVDSNAPSGRYDIRVGVYQPSRDTRVAITQAALPIENNRVVLAPFEVR
jgi:hypothetical protein